MKILQINASYKPAYVYGGPTVSVSMLSEQLVKQGFQVEVFSTTANGANELPVVENTPQWLNGVKVSYFKRCTKDHSHFAPLLCLKLWKTARSFDLIHIHTWWNTVSILSCLIALLRGIPVILSPRGTLSYYSFNNKHQLIKHFFHVLTGRLLLNRCHLHATSLREERRLAHLLKPRSIFMISNLVRLPDYNPLPNLPASPLKLLFLSRIEQKKGLELLFRALAELEFPYQLSIAGDGDPAYISRLKRLAHQYQIEAHIRWLGFKTDDKFDLIANHQVLVLPSYDENFGNVVIESLYLGTAVLVSNKVGLAGYVRKNKFGWVCQPHKNALKECLENIHQNPALLHLIRKSAPKQVAHDFNENKLIKQYIDSYEHTLLLHRINL